MKFRGQPVLHPGLSALFEVGLMFLPAVPAYLWVWPVLEGSSFWIFQCLAYLYVLAGTLFIGLRRWNLRALGMNGHGVALSMLSGLVIVAARTLIILSVEWPQPHKAVDLSRILGEFLFYFGLVGLVEELLHRGLVFHALETWKDVRWAVWGSSIGFVLWHLFGRGPLVGLASLLYRLIFALIRWRAGGILGLILVHGLMDFAAVRMLPSTDVVGLGRPEVLHPLVLALGCALLAAVPLYLWLVHPRLVGKSICLARVL